MCTINSEFVFLFLPEEGLWGLLYGYVRAQLYLYVLLFLHQCSHQYYNAIHPPSPLLSTGFQPTSVSWFMLDLHQMQYCFSCYWRVDQYVWIIQSANLILVHVCIGSHVLREGDCLRFCSSVGFSFSLYQSSSILVLVFWDAGRKPILNMVPIHGLSFSPHPAMKAICATISRSKEYHQCIKMPHTNNIFLLLFCLWFWILKFKLQSVLRHLVHVGLRPPIELSEWP